MKPVKPEVVVITGATAGIGRATARLFAERGAHIGLLARDKDRLEAAQREVEETGGVALARMFIRRLRDTAFATWN